jgi:hypothetical protein
VIRRVVAVVVAVAVLALSGCAQSYDGVLWRQMDAAEGGFVARITDLRETGATRADAVAALKRDTYWDGGTAPTSLGPTAPAVLTHGYRWESGAASFGEEIVLVVDVFASSGLRDEAPRHGDVGAAAVMAYAGPPAIYTCFSVRIRFLDDRLMDWYRPWDDPEQPCPDVLVDRLADGAQYVPIHEFDG